MGTETGTERERGREQELGQEQDGQRQADVSDTRRTVSNELNK